MAEGKTIIGELEKIANAFPQGAGAVALSVGRAFEMATAAGPYEEVLIRHSVGTGTVKRVSTGPEQGVYIIVTGRMYTIDGSADGKYEAVFKAGFTGQGDLTDYPKILNDTYNEPSPIDEVKHLALTKARWTFADGSSCEGPGPAPSYIALLKNGNVQFWVSAGAVIVKGSKKYDGVIGQETSLGSTWFPQPPTLQDGEQFEAKVIHCFRLILKQDRA